MLPLFTTLTQTVQTVPTGSDAGSLLIYFIGACAAMVLGIVGALVSGRVVPLTTLKLVQDNETYHKGRAERLEIALTEANVENRNLSKLQAESALKQSDSQVILAKSLDRFSSILSEEKRRTA